MGEENIQRNTNEAPNHENALQSEVIPQTKYIAKDNAQRHRNGTCLLMLTEATSVNMSPVQIKELRKHHLLSIGQFELW